MSINETIQAIYTVQAKAKARRIRELQEQLIEEMEGLESLAKGASHLAEDFTSWCKEAEITADTLEFCANSVGIDPLLFDAIMEPRKGKN